MDPVSIVALAWLLLAPIFFVLWLIAKRKLSAQASEAEKAASAYNEKLAKVTAEHESTKVKYSGIISQEVEVARLQGIAASLTSDTERLRTTYAEKRALLDRLEQQVAIYDERLAFAELGVCIDPVKICSCYIGEGSDECDDGRQHQTVDSEA